MESFFLAETLKYLYLIFDEENFLHNDLSKSSFRLIHNELGECPIETGFNIFNTEAHPLDGAALECCRSFRANHNKTSLLKQVHLDGLLNKYLRVNEYEPIEKAYETLREELDREDEQQEARFRHLCAKLKNPNLASSCDTTDCEINCSTNDTFQLHVSHLNNINFFP